MKPFALHLSHCPANHGEPCTCSVDNTRTEAEYRQLRATRLHWPPAAPPTVLVHPAPRVEFYREPKRTRIPLVLVILALGGFIAVFLLSPWVHQWMP